MKRKRRAGAKSHTMRIAKDKRSSLFYGAGTVFDIFGTSAPAFRIGSLAGDVLSVGRDFAVVGDTIRGELERNVRRTAGRYEITFVRVQNDSKSNMPFRDKTTQFNVTRTAHTQVSRRERQSTDQG